MSKQLAVESAYLYLKQRILDGTYKPFQKLNETELSEAINVSRNTVKKALLKLEQENLITMEKNKGAHIKSFTLEEVVNYLKIREVLEGLVIKDVAIKITDTELEEMEKILYQMGICLKENLFDEYSNLNKQFHTIIYDFATNRQAVELIQKLKLQLSRLHIRTILVPGRNAESFEEHKNILKALQNHDEKAAETAITKHISNIRLTIEKNYTLLV